MGIYDNAYVVLTRKLDGKGRLILPGDLREAIGLEADDTVEVTAVHLTERNIDGILITKKEV